MSAYRPEIYDCDQNQSAADFQAQITIEAKS